MPVSLASCASKCVCKWERVNTAFKQRDWIENHSYLDYTDWFPGQMKGGIHNKCEDEDEHFVPGIQNEIFNLKKANVHLQ